VPHSSLLLEQYDWHFNMEIGFSVAVVMHICKFIHKGRDKAMVSIVAVKRDYKGGEEVGPQPRDELQEYLGAR